MEESKNRTDKGTLVITRRGMDCVIFEVNGEKKVVDSMEMLTEIRDLIDGHVEFFREMYPIVEHYREYEDKVEIILKMQEDEWARNGEYGQVEYACGENYALYLGTTTSNGAVADNNKAADVLKNAYAREYGDNTLMFDAESSYCYVYTKSREEAKQFRLWVYNKYIRPFIGKMTDPEYKGEDEKKSNDDEDKNC